MADTSTEARTWELRCVGARPLTINRLVNIHRMQWSQLTRESRRTWWALAREARIPRLQRIAIEVTPLHVNNRASQDPGAAAPEAKAAIDGLVDAKVIPDDTGEYVASITFLPPLVCGSDGMQIRIIEVV